MIAQPLRILPNLVVHGARSESGEILALQPFLVPRKFEGVTLSIKRADFPPGVEKCCRDFIQAAGLTGCFHFELLLSPREDRAYYLEINARLGGTTDKVTRLGFDEPGLLLAAFGLLPMQTGTSFAALSGRTAVNKLKVLQHLEWALRGKLCDLDYPAVSRVGHVGRSLLDLIAAEDSLFDCRDLRGSLWLCRDILNCRLASAVEWLRSFRPVLRRRSGTPRITFVGPPGPDGQRVVNDSRTGRYFNLGEQEAFLLGQLDGARTNKAIRAAFEAEFGEPLSDEDLGDFLEMAREEGLL